MTTLKLIEDWLAGIEEDEELCEDDLLELAADEIRDLREQLGILAPLLERALGHMRHVRTVRQQDELENDIELALLRLEQGGILR